MPSKTPAQAKLMRAVAHGWKPDRMKGPSRKVAKEFVAADKKAKGYAVGGKYTGFKGKFHKLQKNLLLAARRGNKKAQAAIRKHASKQERGETVGDFGRWALEQRGQFDPRPGGLAEAAAPPARTIDPVPGREFISGDAPPRRFAAAPPRRTAADVAPGFDPGRVPPALVAYLQSLQGSEPEPVKMQFGGAMNFLRKGSVPPMQQAAGRGQPPGGGGGLQQFLRRGQVPGGGGGGGQFKGMGRGMNSLLQQIQQRRGGAGQGQPRPVAQTQGPESFRRKMPGAPGGGVPLRGVGRPPGMGRPGAGGGASDYQRMLQQRKQQATAGGPQRSIQPVGGGYNTGVAGGSRLLQPQQPTGGAGMPGGANRIGMGDQQGAQARAMQVQTGRPPMSRRQPFPGGGGRGRFGGRGRGRSRFRR